MPNRAAAAREEPTARPADTPGRTGRTDRLRDLLRAARRRRGLTQEALSERSLVSVRTIGDIEAGRQRRPRRDTIEDLLRALDVPHAEAAAIRASLAVDPIPDDVPTMLDPFFGRERELARIAQLLPRTRLLTLCGLAGVGKTRLALAATAAHPTGARVVFVPLASAAQADDVAPMVLARLSGRATRDDALTAIANALRGTPTLLLIDSAEHVRGGIVRLIEAIAGIDGVTVLVTSQVPLGIAHEHVMNVEPLAPADALALLRDRAERAGATGLGSQAQLADICECLYRLPLAIELAAPRLRSLDAAALLERLRHDTGLLVGDGRHRYPTMRDAVAFNYAQLTPDEQTALRSLATFNGAWPLAAAEDICGAAVVAVLDRLVGANFVTRMENPDGVTRYWVLGVIRAFARDQLSDAERRQLDRRHVMCAARLVNRHLGLQRDPADVATTDALVMRTFDACIEDVLPWAEVAARTGMRLQAIEIVAGLHRYWARRGRARWASRLLRAILVDSERHGDVPPDVLASAYRCALALNVASGDIDAAAGLADALRAQALATDLTDADRSRSALAVAFCAGLTGDAERAIATALAGIEAAKAAERRYDVGALLANLAAAYDGIGDTVQALSCALRAARVFEAIGADGDAARALPLAAKHLAHLGRTAESRAAALRALRLLRGNDDAATRSMALRGLALAQAALGHPGRALRLAVAGARAAAETDAGYDVAESADALAVAAEVLDPAGAATALAIADRRRSRARCRPYPVHARERDALADRLRERLGPHAFLTAQDDAVTRGLPGLLERFARKLPVFPGARAGPERS